MGNLGRRRSSSKIRKERKKVSTRMIPQVDQGFWGKSKWEDTNKEDIEPYNRFKREIYTKKRESLPFV